MDAQKIYNRLNDILRKACNHRYIANLSLNLQITYAEAENISSRNDKITILSPRPTNSFHEYRLPQTRIHCREYEQDFIKYTFVEYFDTVFLIIHNNLPENPTDSSLVLPAEMKIICSTKINKTDDQNISFRLNDTALFLFATGRLKVTLQELPALLMKIIESEYKLHPLSRTYCTTPEMLEQTDRLWSKPEMINSDGGVTVPGHEQLSPAALLLLREIYIHIGEERRFNNFIKSTGGGNIIVADILKSSSAGKIKSKSSAINSTKFLDQLLTDQHTTQDSLRAVQEYWEKISRPAMDFALAREIRENPQEIVAFILLAMYQNFWWTDILYKKLILLLGDSEKTLLALLFTMKKMVVFQQETNGFTLRAGSDDSQKCHLEDAEEGFSYTLTRKGKILFSALSLKDELHCRINRSVVFSWDSKQKVLNIKAPVSRPPLSVPELNKMQINLDGYTIQIPLTWSQFEVTVNAVRVKVLQKKKRFQLTFRQRNDFPLISLNGNALDFGGDKKLTIALDIKRQESRLELFPYFLSGRAVQTRPDKMEAFKFCGIALDCYGIIRDDVNVAFNEANHSKNTAAGKKTRRSFMVPYELKKYKLTARKCNPVERSLTKTEPMLEKLLYTPAYVLKNKLTVFLMNDSREKREAVLRKFYRKFAFYPRLEDYRNFPKNKALFSLIVGAEPPGSEAVSLANYMIVRIKSRQVIFIPQENFDLFIESC